MAVVQISRIQVRRGRKNQTGLPQLASGEIAWAIDTQELYIGNGAVSEGAPEVNNTKILTEHDNLLDLAGQYEYKTNDSTIVTGVNANYPIIRSLQERLDERVSVYSFGAVGDGSADDTAALQNAVDQLFMTSIARADTNRRVLLELPPGVYKITDTLYIPSYATIVGVGSEKTVINYIGNSIAVVFVNDSSRPGNINPETTSDGNQPRFINLKGLTIETQTQNQTAMKFDCVIDSVFEDIKVKGHWLEVPDTTISAVGGLHFTALGTGPNSTTTQRNKFDKVTVSGFTYGIHAKWDIFQNEFVDCYVYDCYQGFRLGKGITGSDAGQLTGPQNTTIINCKFKNIKREGIYVDNGFGTRVTGCEFTNVGNNGGGNATATYRQIYFALANNHSSGNYSDRLMDSSTDSLTRAYIGVTGGKAKTEAFAVKEIDLYTISTPDLIFKLPVAAGVTSYEIDYTYRSTTKSQSRRGTISIVVDAAYNLIQLSDDYEWVGDESQSKVLVFSAQLLSIDNTRDTLGIYYVNPADSLDTAKLTYSYIAIQ